MAGGDRDRGAIWTLWYVKGITSRHRIKLRIWECACTLDKRPLYYVVVEDFGDYVGIKIGQSTLIECLKWLWDQCIQMDYAANASV